MYILFEHFSNWWLSILLIIVGALMLHRAIFFTIATFLNKNPIVQVVAKKVELPTLLLFILLGIFAIIDFTQMPEPYCDGTFFSTELFILLTIAWWILRFFSGLLDYQIKQLHEKNDRMRRSHVTQLSFAYKVMSLLVIMFIIGAIFLISPGLKTLGLGLLGSAGIAGIAIGIAAQPLLLNFMAGFQLVMNKTLNIGDAVFIAGDCCTVEEIKTTQVILRTWDGRRHIYPVSTFIQEPYQNWDLKDASKIGRVSIYCDYCVPIKELRKRYEEYIASEPLYNGLVSALFIMDFSHNAVEVVCQCSANSPPELFQLKYKIREEMLRFLQEKYPSALPHIRYRKEVSHG
jgi:small-conductance mechanosensitive channel